MDPDRTQSALLNLVKISAAAEALAVYSRNGPCNVDEHIRTIHVAADVVADLIVAEPAPFHT